MIDPLNLYHLFTEARDTVKALRKKSPTELVDASARLLLAALVVVQVMLDVPGDLFTAIKFVVQLSRAIAKKHLATKPAPKQLTAPEATLEPPESGDPPKSDRPNG